MTAGTPPFIYTDPGDDGARTVPPIDGAPISRVEFCFDQKGADPPDSDPDPTPTPTPTPT